MYQLLKFIVFLFFCLISCSSSLSAEEISILGGIIEVRTGDKQYPQVDEIYSYQLVDGKLLPADVAEPVETYIADDGILIPVETTIPVYEVIGGRLVPLRPESVGDSGGMPVYQIINGKLVLVKRYYIEQQYPGRHLRPHSAAGSDLAESEDNTVEDIIPLIIEHIFGGGEDDFAELADSVIMDADPDNRNEGRVRLGGVVLEEEAAENSGLEPLDIAPVDRRDDEGSDTLTILEVPEESDMSDGSAGNLPRVDARVRPLSEDEGTSEDSAGNLRRVDNTISPLPEEFDMPDDSVGNLHRVDARVRPLSEDEGTSEDYAGNLRRVDNTISPLPEEFDMPDDSVGNLRRIDARVRPLPEEDASDTEDEKSSGIRRLLEISRDSKVNPKPGNVTRLEGKLFRKDEVRKPGNSQLIIPDKKQLLVPSAH